MTATQRRDGVSPVARIEICGGIASGKTTLARLLARAGFSAVCEAFSRNPFLEEFYKYPERYAFETEVCFVAQHLHQIKRAARPNRALIVCDYAATLDLSFADVTLPRKACLAYERLVRESQRQIGRPLGMVFLTCPVDEQLARIRRRRRHFEARIRADYLLRLDAALRRRLAARDGQPPILEIDSDSRDFAHSATERSRTVNQVLDFVSQAAKKCPAFLPGRS